MSTSRARQVANFDPALFAVDEVSGDKVSGGTISTFASTGIDDNADALAMTIDSTERIGVGTTTPGNISTGTNNSTGATINIKSAAGIGEFTAQGALGAALNLVDTAGDSNDKWVRLLVDGGLLKFQTLYDDGSGYIGNPSIHVDLGKNQFCVSDKVRMYGGTLAGSNSTTRLVPTSGMSGGLLIIHGHAYGYAARAMWAFMTGTNQNTVTTIHKSNGWGSTVNNPTFNGTSLQCDSSVINSAFGGAMWMTIGVG